MGDSRYANGGGCQRCHTNEGFVQYATEFGFDTANFDAFATPAACSLSSQFVDGKTKASTEPGDHPL
ncbi:MAG: hypothetical protein WCL50_00380 [Spirochaetota bacterium]